MEELLHKFVTECVKPVVEETKRILKKDGQLVPQCFLFTQNGAISVPIPPDMMNSRDGKDIARNLIQIGIDKTKPFGILTIFDSTLKVISITEFAQFKKISEQEALNTIEAARNSGELPEACFTSRDGLVFSFESYIGIWFASQYYKIQDENKNIIFEEFEERYEMSNVNLKGRFTNMLPPLEAKASA